MSSTPPAAQAAIDRDQAFLTKFSQVRQQLLGQIHQVIVGQDEVVELLLAALFSNGHCLLVGVPGLAKTLMISTLAKALRLDFSRIQFTPDLMPSDITGTDVLEEDALTHKREFRFVKGPVFANIVLADEINRTPPKTQAALLQAMQEYQVTAGGRTYSLEKPFFVLATQNPIEQEGTYPLPEAQLDRFMFMVKITYPDRQQEQDIVRRTTMTQETELTPILGGEDILFVQRLLRKLPVSDLVVSYAVDLARASRPKEPGTPKFINEWLTWGAGPRAAQSMVMGAKAHALLRGRLNVSLADVRTVAKPVLRHRLFTTFAADAEGITTDQVVDKLIESVPEPKASEFGGKTGAS